MRAFIILLALVVVFALIGWITFSNDSGQTSINIETNEIREDTGELMHKGSDLLNQAEEEVAPNRDADQTTTREEAAAP